MTVTLRIADESFQKTWDATVLSSPHSMIFHMWQWLKLAEMQSSMELFPILIYKGTVLVGLYPIFLQKKGFLNLAFSPPSKIEMLYLGPVIVDYESLKQDKKESLFVQIQEEVDKFIFEIKGYKYVRIRTSPGLFDSRPLRWSGYFIDPLYTYRIDLTNGIDYTWKQFSKKLREDINKGIREGVTVKTGNKEDLVFIHDSLSKRFIEQGIKTKDYKKFLFTLYEKFYPENLKIFMAEYNGQRIGGCICLCFKKGMYAWVGSPKTDLIGISPNDVLHWEIIKWAHNNGKEFYEMMDAGDDPRLRHFKSKYNPDLVIWYSCTKHSSFVYKIGETIFNMLRR